MVKMLGQCFWERIHRSRLGDYTGGARSCATDQRNRPVLLPWGWIPSQVHERARIWEGGPGAYFQGNHRFGRDGKTYRPRELYPGEV